MLSRFVILLQASNVLANTCSAQKEAYRSHGCCGRSETTPAPYSLSMPMEPFAPYPEGSYGKLNTTLPPEYEQVFTGTMTPVDVDNCPGFAWINALVSGLITVPEYPPDTKTYFTVSYHMLGSILVDLFVLESRMGYTYNTPTPASETIVPDATRPDAITDAAYWTEFDAKATTALAALPDLWNGDFTESLRFLIGVHCNNVAALSNSTSITPVMTSLHGSTCGDVVTAPWWNTFYGKYVNEFVPAIVAAV